MKMHQLLSAATVALACASASATTVQLVVDVTPTAGQAGHYDNGQILYSNDPSIPVLPTFSLTFQLNLDSVQMNPTQVTNGGFNWYNSTYFPGSTLGTTPYTAGLTAATPPQEQAFWPDHTQTSFSWSMSSYAGGDTRTTWENFYIGNSTAWQNVNQTQGVWTTYNRSLGFDVQGILEAAQFAPKDGAATLAWLNDQIGKTFADGFLENYLSITRKTVQVGDEWITSGDPDAVLSWTQSRVIGDVRITSITVVPEPASGLLMGAGLLILATARFARRQRG